VNPDPNDAPGWYRLGNQREDEGRDVDALACFERAVAADPRHARAWNNLGAASQRLGDARRAEEAYRAALALDPALMQPNLNLGRLHERREEHARAADCYRAALAHHPGDPMLAHLLAAATGANTQRAPRQYVETLFDEQAARFEAHLVGDLGYRVPELLADLARPALAAAARPARVLDLGCGTGLVGAALATDGVELTGVDLSGGMLQQAAKREVYTHLLRSDVLDALRDRADARLAAVVAADVFIYVGDLGDIFAATARALAPGGAFAFSVESVAAGSYQLQPTGRYAHAVPYLRALAEKSGLRVGHSAPANIRRQGQGYATGELLLMLKA
jgi:predicted TPR repeat methyltransferase